MVLNTTNGMAVRSQDCSPKSLCDFAIPKRCMQCQLRQNINAGKPAGEKDESNKPHNAIKMASC